jgi:flagellar protein FliS
MAALNGYQQYAESSVTTASKGKLLLMAYDGAIRFLRQAQTAMIEKHYEDQNTYILKAQRIIMELSSTINRKANPELADQLTSIYEYLFNRLVVANVYDNLEVLKEVETHLLTLRETWAEADRNCSIAGVEGAAIKHSLYAAG